ncbi:putative ATP-dependent helicase [Cladobotryum mycophilum]|uniref:ATP-dependent helicase n=1 Tax=Cladobotryum mycophilum TaxID=491253 RepID=A0ABR0SSC8_9HYPO
MVKERAPPKAPLQSARQSDETLGREKSPESDTDISALISGWSSLKTNVQDATNDSVTSVSNQSTLGHPTRMMSSRKQKADIFIRQRTRPEHHLDNKVSGPKAPAYQDRRAPPLPMFDSNGPVRQPARHNNETFYTDPAKASEDLKALLEGGMDGDDEEGIDGVDDGAKGEPSVDEKKPEGATEIKDPKIISKDGVVDGLKVQLLPHQVEGVNWMRGRELGPVKRGKVPKGGLLADDMGLGKTLQTISLILINQKPKKEDEGWKKHFEGVQKTTLVVAPLALIRQWEGEIRDRVIKTHGLKVLVHHGPQRTKRFEDLKMYDVVITTYQILVSEHGHSSEDERGVKAGCFGLHWWRVVLDEAHTIKNRNAKATKACCALRSEYRWCLSGTPMQNNLDELQSLVKFLRIKPYDDIREWKEQIEKPMKGGKGHIAIHRLHTLLRCFMKRRTKEILKVDGALNPGGKPTVEGEKSVTGFRHTNRKIVTVAAELTPVERKFYQGLEARADKSMSHMMRNKMNYANAFTLLLRLRQACNHPKLLEGKLGEDKDALSTGSSQKSQDADIDAMADLFSGMGISTKSCSICGRPVAKEDSKNGQEHCAECAEDLAYFNGNEKPQKKKSKKEKKPKKEKKSKHRRGDASRVEEEEDDEEEEGDKPTKNIHRPRNRNAVLDSDDEDEEGTKVEAPSQGVRRPRNRNAIIDSDDEEEEAEGSWLVPDGERGQLHLGKAGGSEDENAEGGGDSIGPEDSDDSEEEDAEDQSNLSSFVVNDDVARQEVGYKSADETSDDDSLLSVSAITKKMATQTLNGKRKGASRATISGDDSEGDSGSGSDSSSGSSDDESGSDDDSDISSSDEGPSSGPEILASAKIRELTKILKAEAHEHKFIVFSQFTSMLDLVEPFLRKGKFKFTRYDGSMKNDEREESLRRLREDKSTRVLLCSLKCGSLGLNLTAATRVIIIEPFWNPFVEEQAIDRVHRLTQTVDVVVYKLTVKKTVEEGILELQEKKRQLAEQTIEGSAKKGALKLGINEIIDLFKPIHNQFREGEESLGDYDEDRQKARDTAALMKKNKVLRQENNVYGRRW